MLNTKDETSYLLYVCTEGLMHYSTTKNASSCIPDVEIALLSNQFIVVNSMTVDLILAPLSPRDDCSE